MDPDQPQVDQPAYLAVHIDRVTFVVKGRGYPEVDQVVVVVKGPQLEQRHDRAVVVVTVSLLVLINLAVQVAVDDGTGFTIRVWSPTQIFSAGFFYNQ